MEAKKSREFIIYFYSHPEFQENGESDENLHSGWLSIFGWESIFL